MATWLIKQLYTIFPSLFSYVCIVIKYCFLNAGLSSTIALCAKKQVTEESQNWRKPELLAVLNKSSVNNNTNNVTSCRDSAMTKLREDFNCRGMLLMLLLSNKQMLIWSWKAVGCSCLQGCKESEEIVHRITAIFWHHENQPFTR